MWFVNGSGSGELENEIWEIDWEMEIGKLGMGIGEWGLEIKMEKN